MRKKFRLPYLVVLLALVAVAIAGLGRLSRNWSPRGPLARPPQSETAQQPTLSKATAEQGMQPLTPTIVNGVKTFDLALRRIQWDTGGGAWKDAYSVNNMVPGPELRIMEGERVRIRVKNEMGEPSSIHWHGMIIPAAQDGVAHLSQDPIDPGESFTYEFSPEPAGTHWYHSHFNGGTQVSNGLYGPLIVTPKSPSHPTHPSQYDVDYTILIGDSGLGLTMNGKGFPYNLPLKVDKGQRVLLRLINTGVGSHPMHLHGHDFYLVAKDGNAIAQPMLINTINIAPGETADLKFVANNPGSWLFHCHILPHAEGPDGMMGLTALLEYKGYEPDPNNPHAHQAPSARRLPGTPGKHEH